MRKILLATAAAAALAGAAIGAQAMPGQSSVGTAVDSLNLIENAQFTFEGRRHCWYGRGWHGPGWYWCGYATRRGHGWGGPEGWNGWHRR
jgi:hypothetical protein